MSLNYMSELTYHFQYQNTFILANDALFESSYIENML